MTVSSASRCIGTYSHFHVNKDDKSYRMRSRLNENTNFYMLIKTVEEVQLRKKITFVFILFSSRYEINEVTAVKAR